MKYAALILLSTLFVGSFADVPPVMIVGGQTADAGEFPYQVALLKKSLIGSSLSQFCGGSLIHPQWVLTAGHCVGGTGSLDRWRVAIGVTNLATAPNSAFHSVAEVHRHPLYDASTINYDIALIKLSAPVLYDSYQQAVEVASSNFPESLQTAPTPVNVSGWGLLEAGQSGGGSVGSGTDELQYVTVPMVSIPECETYYPGSLTNNMICAGVQGKDSCQGDSGGPLVVRYQGATVQTGIVSWGEGCATAPGVYTKVSNFFRWIETYTGPLATSY